MLSAAKFVLNSWSIGLDFGVNLVDDLVVYCTLELCDGIEQEFGVNVFGIESNFCGLIH